MLTYCQTAHISLSAGGTGGHVVPVWLVCEHMCLSGWGGDSDALHTRRLCPFFICLKPKSGKNTHTHVQCTPTHIHERVLYPNHQIQPLCFVELPPNLSTRTTLLASMKKAWSRLESTPTVAWERWGWNVSDFEVFDGGPCLRMTEWKYEEKRRGQSLP